MKKHQHQQDVFQLVLCLFLLGSSYMHRVSCCSNHEHHHDLDHHDPVQHHDRNVAHDTSHRTHHHHHHIRYSHSSGNNDSQSDINTDIDDNQSVERRHLVSLKDEIDLFKENSGSTVTTTSTGPEEECGYEMPSEEVMAADSMKMMKWYQIENSKPSWVRSSRIYTIPTYFHVIQTSASTGIITDARIQESINYLNNAFSNSNAPFVFDKRQVTRTVRSDWTKCNDATIEQQIKSALKVGNGDTLNIYICPPMFTARGASLTGFATGPSTSSWTNIKDGVVINNDTTEARLNTLVHEVGHFLGLFHTFGDNTCNADSLGDRVDDTPQHISLASTVNCNSDPSTWDTCPLLPGNDPNDNYMNYSNSLLCRTRFTPGQGTRMVAQYELYRRQAPTPPTAAPRRPPTAAPRRPPTAAPRRPPTAAPRRPPTATPRQPPVAPRRAPTVAPRRAPTKAPNIVLPPSFAELPEEPTNGSCFLSKCTPELKCCRGYTCRLNRGLLDIIFGGRCLFF